MNLTPPNKATASFPESQEVLSSCEKPGAHGSKKNMSDSAAMLEQIKFVYRPDRLFCAWTQAAVSEHLGNPPPWAEHSVCDSNGAKRSWRAALQEGISRVLGMNLIRHASRNRWCIGVIPSCPEKQVLSLCDRKGR